jgi:hypothetical protein
LNEVKQLCQVKKFLLDIGFDYDFVLYGIVSQETPHRLAWVINESLQTNFTREEDMALTFDDAESLLLPRFSYHDELNRLDFDLLSNKYETSFWLPELKKIDYLLMVKGALDSFKKRKFMEPFKHIQSIQIITEINHKKLKQKERLIF